MAINETIRKEGIKKVGLLVEYFAESGGIEQSIVTLCSELVRRGCTVWIYSCRPVSRKNQYRQALHSTGVLIFSLNPLLSRVAFLDLEIQLRLVRWVIFMLSPILFVIAVTDAVFRHRSIRRSWTGVVGKVRRYLDISHLLEKLRYLPLVRYTHRYKPDIIHVHGYGCGFVPAGGISAAALCRLPIVYSEHGIPWNGLQDSSKIIRDLKQVNSLIAISEDSAECIRKSCLWSSKIPIIRHIVPMPVIKPGIIKHQSYLPLTITCVAMMRPEKGHAILLQAAAQVIESYPQTQFFLIGDGPTRSDLEKQACKLGISDQIIFKGVLSHSEVECAFQQTDIFVLPTFRESLGIAMIEAMSYGLPVVGTNAGGLLDLVKNGKNGLLVPPGNPDALADALRALIENPSLRTKLAKAAQQSYTQGEFTPQAVGDAILSVYREAVEIYHSQLGR